MSLIPLKETKQSLPEKPMISICCTTYNHRLYLREAIESFLMQQIDYPVEIIIRDDASTDGTTEILREYADLYPNIIRAIIEPENQGSKGVSAMLSCFSFATGKYIAFCEGDDFWTDPLKLQKQVDFLENNPDYELIHTECDYLYSNGRVETRKNEQLKLIYDYKNNKEYLFDLIINEKYKIRTLTILFTTNLLRRTQQVRNDYKGLFLMGDTPLFLIFSQETKFHYMDATTCMYRIAPNSATRQKNLLKNFRFTLSMSEMRIWFLNYYKKAIPEEIANQYNNSLITYKMLDFTYQEMFPLINPTAIQQRKYQRLENNNYRIFARSYFLRKQKLKFFIKSILAKMKK